MRDSSLSEKGVTALLKFLSSAHDLFNVENGIGFFPTIRALHFENSEGIVLGVGAHHSFLLDFVVEPPLVDLDPGQSSLAHGFILHFAGRFTIVVVEYRQENVYLVVSLSASVAEALLKPSVDHVDLLLVSILISC